MANKLKKISDKYYDRKVKQFLKKIKPKLIKAAKNGEYRLCFNPKDKEYEEFKSWFQIIRPKYYYLGAFARKKFRIDILNDEYVLLWY